jgi:predicted flap endonuclease-1-like 5' DNA nuclease/uncharacterized protein YoxC
MAEITVTHIAIVVSALIIGVIVGWIVRGRRAVGEKAAINEGWQEQIEAQRNEHERLLDQNKRLMEQTSQYQASNKDAKMRASELADALKETFERRDELQRQLKDVRSNLESAVSERNQLRNNPTLQDMAQQLEARDARIEKLETELKNWQDRLPPLIERYQQRNAEASELERQLTEARERIEALDNMVGSEQTRAEPIDREALGDAMDASNEPIDDDAPPGDQQPMTQTPRSAAEEQTADDDSTYEEIDRDNLKLIKGVGPAIEKTLNEMGISRFDQIAQMSEYDIDRVAHRLKGFRSRIYREDWIGQARDLHDQKVSGQQ